jgi:thiol-disulfide isomerase/thioredoxin
LLAQSVVRGYGDKARFVSENFGDSAVAKKFGVTRYPAIFVDDVLVATPKDFGFYGKGEGEGDGKYTPWKNAQSHERFRSDLTRMIDLLLAGRKDAARAEAVGAAVAPPGKSEEARDLPNVTITDLNGKSLTRADLAGRPVLVELWATWCPPCRSTLAWLGELQKKHGDRLAVVTIAVDSDEANVRKVAEQMKLPIVWAMGKPDVVRALGDVTSVPTLLLFDSAGKSAGAFYGAPPDLHPSAEARIATLLK